MSLGLSWDFAADVCDQRAVGLRASFLAAAARLLTFCIASVAVATEAFDLQNVFRRITNTGALVTSLLAVGGDSAIGVSAHANRSATSRARGGREPALMGCCDQIVTDCDNREWVAESRLRARYCNFSAVLGIRG